MPIIGSNREIFHNAKLQIYPNEVVKITVCNNAIFKESGWEKREQNICSVQRAPEVCDGEVSADIVGKSVRRAKNKIFDIALCNTWDFFVTLTFNSDYDRYDSKQISQQVKNWCRNMVNRNDLKYLLVPEYHKDGAVHLHGLLAGDIKPVKAFYNNKPIYQNKKRVYNVDRWHNGFSTATKVKDGFATAKYITKYITKDVVKIFGNYYYAGGDIVREPEIVLTDVDFNEYVLQNNLKTYFCKETKNLFAYNEIK